MLLTTCAEDVDPAHPWTRRPRSVVSSMSFYEGRCEAERAEPRCLTWIPSEQGDESRAIVDS